VQKAQPIASDATVRVLARFGDRPLVWTREAEGRREVGLAFDPEDSNLPLRVAFPVLLYNAIDWLAAAAPSERRTPGTRWLLPIGGVATLESPGGVGRLETRGDRLLVDDTQRAGLYRVRAGADTFRVAASLSSPSESDLRTPARTPPRAPPAGRDLWSGLVLLALALALIEWQLFHRRWTR
jgi:hypothetical protein